GQRSHERPGAAPDNHLPYCCLCLDIASSKLDIASSKEDTVVFCTELRESSMRRRWVGFEVEAVSGFRRRGDGDGNLRGTLEEIAAEPVHRVSESEYATRDAAPLDLHRLDNRAEDP